MTTDLIHTLQQTPSGLTLAELLTQHPQVARRTAQRWLRQWADRGLVLAQGEGRSRRYLWVTTTPTGTET